MLKRRLKNVLYKLGMHNGSSKSRAISIFCLSKYPSGIFNGYQYFTVPLPLFVHVSPHVSLSITVLNDKTILTYLYNMKHQKKKKKKTSRTSMERLLYVLNLNKTF